MQVKQLTLHHYRNYRQIELQTDHRVNIFVGENAQGKTNILESLLVLALTKSHRTHHDRELIQWGQSSSLIRGRIERRYGDCSLELQLSAQGKKAKINELEQRKLSDYIGAFNVVLFAPEDLNIVKGSPGVRRRFLDMEIGQVYPAYVHHLSQYQKVLAHRNNALKQMTDRSSFKDMLDVWNEQLAGHGIKIMQKRQSFIQKLQSWASRIHGGITADKENMVIQYIPSVDVNNIEDETVLFKQFMLKLSQAKEQELKRKMTLVGPHRDDLAFSINGKDVQTYGSQGQQRTTALSLKLAEIELIREEVGEYPVLLLDDVLSELDRNRQTQLIETFQNKVQTFITTTGIESVNLDKLTDAHLFHVDSGSISN